MSVIDQIKVANAGRRMFNSMCNKCRLRMVQEFSKDYKVQQQTGKQSLSPQETVERTKAILCNRCQKVFDEAMVNR